MSSFIDETEPEQIAYFKTQTRELIELNMQAARIAGERIAAQHLAGTADQGRASADPTLALARATNGVNTIIKLELSATRAPRAQPAAPPPRAPSSDPRRNLLRAALLPAADIEPDSGARKALQREINQHIEAALVADPEAEIPLPKTFIHIGETLGLTIDLSKVSDEVIGMPPRHNPIYDPPGPKHPRPEPPH